MIPKGASVEIPKTLPAQPFVNEIRDAFMLCIMYECE